MCCIREGRSAMLRAERLWGCWDVGKKGCRDVGKHGCGDTGMWGCRDIRRREPPSQHGKSSQCHRHICTVCLGMSPVPSAAPVSTTAIQLNFPSNELKPTALEKPNQTNQQKTGCACSGLFAAPDEKGLGTCLDSVLKETGRVAQGKLRGQLWLPSPCLSQGPRWPDCSPAACPSQARPWG